jgi:hypothetical protein
MAGEERSDGGAAGEQRVQRARARDTKISRGSCGRGHVGKTIRLISIAYIHRLRARNGMHASHRFVG